MWSTRLTGCRVWLDSLTQIYSLPTATLTFTIITPQSMSKHMILPLPINNHRTRRQMLLTSDINNTIRHAPRHIRFTSTTIFVRHLNHCYFNPSLLCTQSETRGYRSSVSKGPNNVFSSNPRRPGTGWYSHIPCSESWPVAMWARVA